MMPSQKETAAGNETDRCVSPYDVTCFPTYALSRIANALSAVKSSSDKPELSAVKSSSDRPELSAVKSSSGRSEPQPRESETGGVSQPEKPARGTSSTSTDTIENGIGNLDIKG